MRRVAGVFTLTFVFFALIFGCVFVALAPPETVVRWFAASVLKISAQWAGSYHKNGSLRFQMVSYPFPLARLEANEAVVKNGIARSILTGIWEIDFLISRVQPADPRWPRMDFTSGQAIWRSKSKILELRNWTSKLARLDADIHFDGTGKLIMADVRGDADASELAKAISGWKILKADSGVERKAFHFVYTNGQFSISVDEKPFFKASWRGNVNF